MTENFINFRFPKSVWESLLEEQKKSTKTIFEEQIILINILARELENEKQKNKNLEDDKKKLEDKLQIALNKANRSSISFSNSHDNKFSDCFTNDQHIESNIIGNTIEKSTFNAPITTHDISDSP